MTGTYLDLTAWPRRKHYEFYRGYDQPFFTVTADVCVTQLYQRTSARGGPSFFLSTLFESLRAANHCEEFKLRLRPEGVWRHDRIHGGSTISRPDETFGFGYFEFNADYEEFERRGRRIIAEVAASDALEPLAGRDDMIHHSVLPWIRFTSFAHARKSNPLDSVPKIVFGKRFERDADFWMPVSVEVHHALVDGLHVGRYLEAFQSGLEGGRDV
jgi:chloramphenicol O-acetyltransferase type A